MLYYHQKTHQRKILCNNRGRILRTVWADGVTACALVLSRDPDPSLHSGSVLPSVPAPALVTCQVCELRLPLAEVGWLLICILCPNL